MQRRNPQFVAALPLLAAVGGCAAYVPPGPTPTPALSRDVSASSDRTWRAIAQLAAEKGFTVQSADPASGRMILTFWSTDPSRLVDCGRAIVGPAAAGTPALTGLGFHKTFLTGTTIVSIRPNGPQSTSVQVNDRYSLSGYIVDQYGWPQKLAQWDFGSGSSDTERVGVRLVTCRSAHVLGPDLLGGVAAQF